MNKKLYEMTWQEAKQAFEKKKVAVIPVGSQEQHGPALPLGTDWMIAEHLANKLAERSDQVIVTPVVPFGHATYHADFPGTLAVSTGNLANYLTQVCEQLIEYGITHILFVNGHGGNNTALFDVGQHFRLRNIPVANIQWFNISGDLNPEWGLLGHGDIYETSLMLHIAPELVRMDLAGKPTNKSLASMPLLDLTRAKFEKAAIFLNLRTRDVSESGDLWEYGHSVNSDHTKSPADATAELGQAIIEEVVDYMARFVAQFVTLEFEFVK